MKYFITLLLVATLTTLAFVEVNAVRLPGRTRNYEQQFREWMADFDKVYVDDAEYYRRLSNFITNLGTIARNNRMHKGRATFGVNKFADLSMEEFKSYYLNFETDRTPKREPTNVSYPSNIPSQVDWRQKGYVTPVKNQEQCGSCWAFSAAEQIESAYIMLGNEAQIASEQQIVDCDSFDGGCGGGDTMTAYKYVETAGGLTTNASYPYTAQDGTCYANKTKKFVKVTNYNYASSQGNETQLKEAIAALGPLSICVDAISWMTYQSGIITSNCGNDLDHCVQLVGYAIESSVTPNIPYYIVRNSWGLDWGQEGYIYIGEGQNLCGITDEVSYVEVEALD
ncbi:hypothetical protein SAMD00019534_034130, partial [Acytostelium subglobosum LB1]|uniref:hypothetical protein n=1 Tax=Acytostelium subglobosum LB1 TaxID=1410327 RepID=UPI000644BEB2